ncbi:MAG: tetratricopeptide repeat protein [Candidatus Omnitrophica bacterium]|nr:tetratricopeptide repeat protein [Candidatus Omnitrophota bacterium]
MNKKNILAVLIVVIMFIVSFIAIRFKNTQKETTKQNKVISVGLEPSKQEYFSKKLSNSFRDVRLLDVGAKLIDQGKVEEAIKYFKNLIAKDKSFGMKGLARNYLADAYEKNGEYTKAYQVLYEKSKQFKVPVTSEVRAPYEERLKYLKYASEGEYELAIEHAQMALEASKKDNPNLKTIPKGYQQRLNDLKASKAYIESLKNNH